MLWKKWLCKITFYFIILNFLSIGLLIPQLSQSLATPKMANALRTLKHRHRIMTLLLSSTVFLFCFYFQNSLVVFAFDSYSRYVYDPAPCPCHTCALARGRADWFSARYKPTVHLLLNSSNSALRADVFRWWKVSSLKLFRKWSVTGNRWHRVKICW